MGWPEEPSCRATPTTIRLLFIVIAPAFRVFPGEVITINLWKDGNSISFEACVRERRVTVVKNGQTVLH